MSNPCLQWAWNLGYNIMMEIFNFLLFFIPLFEIWGRGFMDMGLRLRKLGWKERAKRGWQLVDLSLNLICLPSSRQGWQHGAASMPKQSVSEVKLLRRKGWEPLTTTVLLPQDTFQTLWGWGVCVCFESDIFMCIFQMWTVKFTENVVPH